MPSMKNWYSIKAASAAAAPVEISIFDEIGYWGVTAKDFISEFKAKLGDSKEVVLAINSPGGDVFQGFAIFNALKAVKAAGVKVKVKVMGIAASMASVIAMAGDEIEMPDNAMIMVHNAISGVYGDAEDLRAVVNVLDQIDNSIVATYSARTGKSEQEIRDLMAADTFMSAARALDLGFTDTVTESISATACFDTERLPENVRALFTRAAVTLPAPERVNPLAEQIQASATAAGLADFAAMFATDASLTTLEAAQAAIAVAKEIKSYAAVAGRPDDAAALIRERKTVAEARTALAKALADADAATGVDTARKSTAVASKDGHEGFSPTALWADIKAMKEGKK